MLLAPPQTAFPAQQAAFPEGFFPPQPPAAYKWFPHPSYYQFDADYARNQPYMYPPAEFYPVDAWPNAMPGAPLAILAAPDGAPPMPPISAHLVPEGMPFAPFPFDPHQHEGIMNHHVDSSSAHDWQRGGRGNTKGTNSKPQSAGAKAKQKPPSITSGSIQVRKRDAKQLLDNTMSVEVLHKPRGSQGVWVAIESGQRVRVTYGRGKNVRVVVRSSQRRDWSSLRLFLVEHQDDDSEPVVEKESKHSFSVEAREVKTDLTSTEVPLQMVQFEVKVFMIHATISFRAEYDAPDGSNSIFYSDSPKMSTHNSGRRDAEAKRKAAMSKGGDAESSKNDDGESSDEAKRRPKRKSAEDAIMEDILMQPPPAKLPTL